MIRTKQNGKTIYSRMEGNDFGEYYTIDKAGDLAVYDNQGWIYTAYKK